MTTKTMFEMTIDDFEKFKEEVLGVLECIYEENLIYKPCTLYKGSFSDHFCSEKYPLLFNKLKHKLLT